MKKISVVRNVRWLVAGGLAVWSMAIVAGCTPGPAVLTNLVEARRLASALHVEFTKANEAANRAVMGDTDAASVDAAKEAEQATRRAVQSLQQLRPLLTSLGYQDELQSLNGFTQRFTEFQTLDAEILPLAVENTNLKAQRLSFGAAQDAVDAFSTALLASVKQAPVSSDAANVAATSRAALLEMQVLQARHIAEADEAAMLRMESQMAASEGVARKGLARLRALIPASVSAGSGGSSVGPGSSLESADVALERFISANQQIVELSRRNSNVRSLALTLGRKRVVAAECADQLRALEESLGKHGSQATR